MQAGGVGGTVASESALRSAGALLSRVRALPSAPWPDGGPESLRSPCCGLATYKNQTYMQALYWRVEERGGLLVPQRLESTTRKGSADILLSATGGLTEANVLI
ncbi:hypothetical protein PoB_000999900 [Plakobranchus ocellatus]|uniref:Uncharacterized protein n=1 Tax=Plakobranchus ocellatus TaxID=259542 RepID=A0AAV3YN05_9GAST|nr:hypothetical protein PoB_000999900 [Plakobranchus ocellatus]